MSEQIRTRLVAADIRPVEWRTSDQGAPEATEFEFVAATENPVRVFDPTRGRIVQERLLMSGLDLESFRRNPVVLDTHRRQGSEYIVGRAVFVRAEEGQLRARIRFTEATAAGKRNLRLVREGTLRTLSIGYEVHESQQAGTTDRGDPLVEARAWSLREISTAPVPADPEALLRAAGIRQEAEEDGFEVQTLVFDKERFSREEAVNWAEGHDFRTDKVDETEDSYRLRKREPGDFERLRTIELDEGVQAIGGPLKEGRTMANRQDPHAEEEKSRQEDVEGDEKGEEGEGTGSEARRLIQEAEDLGYTHEEIGSATDRSPGVIGAIKSGEIMNPPTDFLDKIKALIRKGPKEDTGEGDMDRSPPLEELSARQIEARKREVLAFTPPELHEYAHGLFLEDPTITAQTAREALLAERARRLKPVGTPQPPEPGAQPAQEENKTTHQVTAADLAAAFNVQEY